MYIKRLLGDNLIVSMHAIPLEKLLGISVCFSPLERDYKHQQLTATQILKSLNSNNNDYPPLIQPEKLCDSFSHWVLNSYNGSYVLAIVKCLQ